MILDIEIKGSIPAEIDLDMIVTELNELPLMKRWEYVAGILNNVHLRNIDELEPGQKDLILNFLERNKKIYAK